MIACLLPSADHSLLTFTIERLSASRSGVVMRLKRDCDEPYPFLRGSPWQGVYIDLVDKKKNPVTGLWARVSDPAPLTEASFDWVKPQESPRWSFEWNRYFAVSSDRDGTLGKVIQGWMSVRYEAEPDGLSPARSTVYRSVQCASRWRKVSLLGPNIRLGWVGVSAFR